MAEFKATVVRLTIEEHPNADVLELAQVGGYQSIVPKGKFKTGDYGVYIPEQAVLPEWLITALGLEGKLAGKAKNRVKAIKLRKILSQGLVYPTTLTPLSDEVTQHSIQLPHVNYLVAEGTDVTEAMGITKYEPPIPTCMAGEVFNAMGRTIKYDIENLKWHTDVINVGEEVVITEKLHGTWACFGYHPDFGNIVTSKGLSGKGLAFKFNDNNARNLYLRVFEQYKDKLDRYLQTSPIYFLGEIFGQGVQDLAYGCTTPQFRGFDIYVGQPGQGRYLDHSDKAELFAELGIDMVPVLYKGPFIHQVVEELTSGSETVSGTSACIREGVVITPTTERRDDELGRVILKSVSEAYLLRRNATEYN